MGLIFVDACLVIYAFEDHPQHGSAARAAFRRAAAGQLAVTSLIKLECLVGPMRSGNLVLQQHYEQGLAQFALLPLTDPVFVQAAMLRARFNVKTPDAIHLAAAQHHGCQALWTNDDRLAQASHGLAINVL